MFGEQSTPGDAFEWDARTIRALRAYLGWSQSTLARDLGIRQQTVSEWETGMYKPRGASVTILNLLARTAEFDGSIARQVEQEPGRPAGRAARTSALPRTGLLAAGPPLVAPQTLQRLPISPANRVALSDSPFPGQRGGGGQATEDVRYSPPADVHSYSPGDEVPM